MLRKNLKSLRGLIREAAGDKPVLYFLIGPPAVGKSTWIGSNLGSDVVVANRDEIVARVAAEGGIGSYDDMFTRPPADIVPPGMPGKADLAGPDGTRIAGEYLAAAKRAAADFNRSPANSAKVKRFGHLVPFTEDELITVVVKYGVPPQHVVPFSYEKLKGANELVGKQLDQVRSDAVGGGKSIAIDMTNISVGERDGHRSFIVGAITGVEPGKANPRDVSKYYDQVAIVFANEGGYTDDEKEKIKRIAGDRAEEARAAGSPKTIPASAYDRMFTMFAEPTGEEGFKKVEYVGIPSLRRLRESIDLDRWRVLSGL